MAQIGTNSDRLVRLGMVTAGAVPIVCTELNSMWSNMEPRQRVFAVPWPKLQGHLMALSKVF